MMTNRGCSESVDGRSDDGLSAERLADVFVEFADTLIEDYDVIEFLLMVTNRTAELVGRSDVGLLLADQRRRLQFLAGSNEAVKRLEFSSCRLTKVLAWTPFSGEAVVNADLSEAADRWPRFAPRASVGLRTAHAFPLRLRPEVIGAMGVFGGAMSGAGSSGGSYRAGPGARCDHRAAPGTGYPPW